MSDWYIGLDLGQAKDFTAWCAIERVQPMRERQVQVSAGEMEYHVRHVERFRLGTRYPEIASRLADVRRTGELARAVLVVDATGVGRAVVDMLGDAGLNPVAVTITAGARVASEGGGYHVPKRDLVAALQTLLQSHRLKIAASLPDAGALVRELENFRIKVTLSANDTYEAWREGDHDDLVLAVGLGCWHALNHQPWGGNAGALALAQESRWTVGTGEPTSRWRSSERR